MKYLPVLLLTALLTTVKSPAQNIDNDKPFFDAVSFAARSSDSTVLDLSLAVPYGTLTFDRVDGRYTANYRAHITVEEGSKKWFDSTFTRTVATRSYDVSSGAVPTFEFIQQRVTLPPGSYTATANLLDVKSNLVNVMRKNVTAVDYANLPFSVSGLVLVGKIREDSTGFVITPMFTDNVSAAQNGYFLFFEAYNRTGKELFTLRVDYRSARQDSIAALSISKKLPAGRSQQWIRLPSIGVARGVYTLEMTITPQDDPATVLASTRRTVRFSESLDGMPITENELDEKIVQLRYVASQSEVDDIRAGEGYIERRKRFAAFWDKLDPTPGTAANEAMTEYFRRIDYANEHFKSYAAGWLTDKGRVYIIYGPPDNISTDTFRRDGRAVETWQYYSRNLRLTFVDDSGFGDYRLITQVPLGEKYRYPG